jgi:hypothetical protein
MNAKFRLSGLCLFAAVLLCLPQKTGATSYAFSQIFLTDLSITPSSGTLEFIGDWKLTTYAEAGGSWDFHEGLATVSPSFADSAYSHADAHASATHPPTVDVQSDAHSEGLIPGDIDASDYALARGTHEIKFKITGGSGPVEVEYAANLNGFLEVANDIFGIYAEAEAIFGLEQDGEVVLMEPFPLLIWVYSSDSKALPFDLTLSAD